MYQGDAVADLFPDEVETLNNTEFKRLSQVFRNLAVFNDINPDDISQGQLGNCYFLSGIASLAEFPDRVKRIFLTQEPNDAGVYCI